MFQSESDCGNTLNRISLKNNLSHTSGMRDYLKLPSKVSPSQVWQFLGELTGTDVMKSKHKTTFFSSVVHW